MAADLVASARELRDALAASRSEDAVDGLVARVGAAIGGASPEAAAEAMGLLAAAVGRLAPEGAGVAARVVGAMIEAGRDPAPARTALVGALQASLPSCARLVDDAEAEIGAPPAELDADQAEDWLAERQAEALNEAAARRPAAARAWQLLLHIWPGAVALLSADADARAEARELAPACERIQELHEAGGWLRALLCVLDDAPFVAIEPATGAGVGGRMSGVVENFQLSVLLMDALPSAAPRVSPEAVAVARGEGPQRIDEQVAGAWNLYTYAALRPGGGLPAPTDLAHAHTWIWHEGMPADIPELDGRRVILLGPPEPVRTWPAQRMFLLLAARLEAEPLGASEVARWLERIAAAAAR